ncbi:MAG: hypothetical protein RR397_08715 [Odoribacter sp.]
MKGKCLVGIFISFLLVFGINGIQGELLQESRMEMPALEQQGEEDCLSSLRGGYGTIGFDDYFSFESFRSNVCDIPVLVSFSSRGTNFPRNLKFISTIQALSSYSSPLVVKNARNQYFHYCFVKSSYRYFIYTLERLLI